MQGVVVAVPTHRGFPFESTKAAVRALVSAGAELKVASKISDIAGGRSWLLTEALESAEAQNRDVILCIDDDMDFTTEQAQAVVDQARRTGIATSAIYCTEEGNFAGYRWQHPRFLTGLGFIAIPVRLLRYVASQLPYVKFNAKRRIYAFCESRAQSDDDEWRAEDYDLCRKLGGVLLAPFAVGHIKPIALVPADQDVQRLLNWETSETIRAPLPADDEPPPTERRG